MVFLSICRNKTLPFILDFIQLVKMWLKRFSEKQHLKVYVLKLSIAVCSFMNVIKMQVKNPPETT